MPFISTVVTTAGTAISMAPTTNIATTTGYYVTSMEIVAKKQTGDNAGTVYIGNSTVDKTTAQFVPLAKGNSWDVPIPHGARENLLEWFVDADNNNDGVVIEHTQGP